MLSIEQEILREHGRWARVLANQGTPLSACTWLRDEEVYSFTDTQARLVGELDWFSTNIINTY